MFNLFKKKERLIPVNDRVSMSDQARLHAMLTLANTDPEAVFIFWFDESMSEAASFFESKGQKTTLYHAREVAGPHVSGKNIFFAEHYPLQNREQELFEKLHLPVAIVYTSLTDPLFKQFGGERIIALMVTLGLDDEALIEHPLISKSIRNAQKKLGKKISIEQPTHSATDWFERNLIDV